VNRKEAISLFTELVAHGFINPNFVSIEQKELGKYQLKIMGDYDFLGISTFVQAKNFVVEEDKDKKCILVHRL
jgi:hypothetical protein